MKKTVLVGILMLFAATAVAAGKLQVYPGAWSAVSPADLAVHPLKKEAYTESWFFMVQAPSDVWLFVHFGISNLQPLSDFDGVVETTVLRNGKVTFVKDKLSSGKLKYSQTGLDVTMGKNTLKAGPDGWLMHVDQDGVKLDATFKPMVAGVKPGRSLYPGGEYYELQIAAPRAEASGTLTLDGKPLPVQGSAYFDHSIQDFPAHKMADRLYSFRGFNGADGVNFLSFQAPKDLGGSEMPTLVLIKGDQVVAKTAVVHMAGTQPVSDDDNDYSYPTQWSFEGKDGDAPVTGSITLGKRLHSQNAAEDFNMFERTLIKAFVANPILYRHTGTFNFSLAGKTPASVSGNGIAEILILRQ
jgi:hypothetical protein